MMKQNNFGDNTFDMNEISRFRYSGSNDNVKNSSQPPPMGLVSGSVNKFNISYDNTSKNPKPVNVWDLMTLHDVKKYQNVSQYGLVCYS